MAEFRSIHSKMWRDSWFTELDIDGKLLWVYLITNSAASLTGIYYMTVKFAAFETGLSQERVTTLLAQFVLSGKIEYENDVVWIRRMRKYQAANETSPRIAPRIIKDLSEIPDCKVKRLYLNQYPIDTVSIPDHTETDTETDTDTETEKNCARAAQNELFGAICSVCVIDPKVKGNGAKIGKARAALSESEPPYTADDVRAFGTWWNSDDWRRKKGPPTVWKLIEQIAIVRNGHGGTNGGNGNGSKRDSALSPDDERKEQAIADEINRRRAEKRLQNHA